MSHVFAKEKCIRAGRGAQCPGHGTAHHPFLLNRLFRPWYESGSLLPAGYSMFTGGRVFAGRHIARKPLEGAYHDVAAVRRVHKPVSFIRIDHEFSGDMAVPQRMPELEG